MISLMVQWSLEVAEILQHASGVPETRPKVIDAITKMDFSVCFDL